MLVVTHRSAARQARIQRSLHAVARIGNEKAHGLATRETGLVEVHDVVTDVRHWNCDEAASRLDRRRRNWTVVDVSAIDDESQGETARYTKSAFGSRGEA